MGARRASFVFTAALACLAAVACADLSGLASDGPSTLGPLPTRDAGADGKVPGTPTDGATPMPSARCNPANPFSPPELMVAFDATTDNVKGAVLTPDELEVFYLRYQSSSSSWELRHAGRAQRDATFGAVTTMAVSPSPDGFLSLSAGGLKLYFWTIDADYRSTRATTSDAFGVPAMFDRPSAPAPFVVASDDTAYFAVYESDGGAVSQDRVIKQGTTRSSGFSDFATAVPNVHAMGAYDETPVLDVSERILYFASNRSGGKGVADVWVARRASKQLDFGAPVHVPELSTDLPDQVTWVSEDDCEVFLDRSSHIYRAVRPL